MQDTFQGRQVCMPLLYFAYTPPKAAVQHRAADGQRVAAKLQPRSAGGRNKDILLPEQIELAVIMGYKFTGPSGFAVPLSLECVTQDNDNLSSQSSQDSNPCIRTVSTQDKSGMSSWAVGGTQRQRIVPSSLGRQTHDVDNLSSETSQDSNSRHHSLRVESLSMGVLSSLPSTVRPQRSASMDVPDGSSDSRRGRKFWNREYIPVHNIMVFDTTKLFLQAEVLACHPWQNTATIENMISRNWIRAIET
jgi:hypothetical protein